MGNALLYAVAFLGVLGVLILVHEFGHYALARLCGVRVLRFSLGFGKPLVTRVMGADKTEWCVGAIPLGGYVKMLDEREAPVDPDSLGQAFNRQSLGKRAAIVAAGPAANFLLAFLVYVFLFWQQPEFMQAPPPPEVFSADSLPRLGRVLPASPAERAGLQVGDDVLAVEGVAVDRWKEFSEIIQASPGKSLDLLVLRGAETLHVLVKVEGVESGDRGGRVRGRIGVMVAPREGYVLPPMQTYNFIEAVQQAAGEVYEKSLLTLSSMGRMLMGELPWKHLSGPVTIADYAGQTAKMGLPYYLKFMALLSISLGVLNLLPVPVLDGGHLMYYLFELVRGKPLPEHWLQRGQRVGLALLFVLMVFAVFNDLSRLISG